MTRDQEKIDEILKLTGVPRRDFELIAPTLAALSSSELDKRLSTLRARNRRLIDWRNNRVVRSPISVSESSNVPGLEILTEIKKSTDNLEAEVRGLLLALSTFRRSEKAGGWAEAWIPTLLDVLSIAKTRIEDLWTSSPQIRTPTVDSQISLEAANSAAIEIVRGISQQVGGYLGHPALPVGKPLVRWSGAIEAIARLENNLIKYKPDALIAANEEGYQIAWMLTNHLGMHDIPIIRVDTLGTDLRWRTPTMPIGTPRIIALVGHVAHSGKTLSKTLKVIKQRFDTPTVYCMTLASSQEAVLHLASDCSLIYHHVAFSENPRLDFDPALGIEIMKDGYAVNTGEKSLPIPSGGIDIAREEVAEAFPTEGLPWLPAIPVR